MKGKREIREGKVCKKGRRKGRRKVKVEKKQKYEKKILKDKETW